LNYNVNVSHDNMSTVGIVEDEPTLLPTWSESNFAFDYHLSPETPWLVLLILSTLGFVLSFLKR